VYADLWAGRLTSQHAAHEQLGKDYLFNLQVSTCLNSLVPSVFHPFFPPFPVFPDSLLQASGEACGQ
jgi:hypothetical protein